MPRCSFAALCALGVAGPALGAFIITPIASDALRTALLPESQIGATAEGRIGDRGGNGTFELDLGRVTSAPDTQANFPWVSDDTYNFSLTYDAGMNLMTFIMDVGGPLQTTLLYNPVQPFSQMFIRARAINADASILLTHLALDGMGLGVDVGAVGDGLDIIWVRDSGVADGFSLVGEATLEWGASVPTQSRLAFQVKLGVPAPGAASLGLLGLAGAARRRR